MRATGRLIVDTARSLASLTAQAARERRRTAADQPKPQNFWTRFTRYFFKEPLPVYQEIDAANGMAYPEVRDALAGNERSMLLLNKKGEQIVSMAVPIRRFKNMQGVLLLSTRPGQIDKILREERVVILTLAAMALLASVVTSLAARAHRRRAHAAAVGGRRAGEPQHRRARAAARACRPLRRGGADGGRLPGHDGGALPAHRGQREVRRRRGARAEEPAHGGALHRRIAELRQDRRGARPPRPADSRTSSSGSTG